MLLLVILKCGHGAGPRMISLLNRQQIFVNLALGLRWFLVACLRLLIGLILLWGVWGKTEPTPLP